MSKELKAKLYDVQEELKLAQDVEPNEQGVIDLKNIVKAVTVLTSDAMV